MSKYLGIDFGTTNSTIAVFDSEIGKVEPIDYSNGRGIFYIPSSIIYETCEESISDAEIKVHIGQTITALPNKQWKMFEHYKLDLIRAYVNGGNDSTIKNVVDGRMITVSGGVIRIVCDYIKSFLLKYKKIDNDDVVGVVITLPNIIASSNEEEIFINSNLKESSKQRDYRLAIHNKLKSAVSEVLALSIDSVSICGESACACYFHIKQAKNELPANFIVIDYGGGTLDVANCPVKDGSIDVTAISSKGTGVSDNGRDMNYGFAGYRYDLELVKLLLARYHEYESVVGAFSSSDGNAIAEDLKIRVSNDEFNCFKTYYANRPDEAGTTGYLNEVLRGRDGLPESIDLAMFDTAFLKANFEQFVKLLSSILRFNSNMQSPQEYQFLLTGGFSNLYCVEFYLKLLLNRTITVENDAILINGVHYSKEIIQRIQDAQYDDISIPSIIEISPRDKITAVACGAALYAAEGGGAQTSNNIYSIVSIRYFDGKERSAPLYQNGQVNEEKFYINNENNQTVCLQFGNELDRKQKEIILPIKERGNQFLYFSVVLDDRQFKLIVRDEAKNSNQYKIII